MDSGGFGQLGLELGCFLRSFSLFPFRKRVEQTSEAVRFCLIQHNLNGTAGRLLIAFQNPFIRRRPGRVGAEHKQGQVTLPNQAHGLGRFAEVRQFQNI